MNSVILIIALTALSSTISVYIDKHIMNLGITRHDYFYYMCLSMIPFAFAMMLIEYFTGSFKFVLSIVPIIFLIIAMIFRYIKQHALAGMGQKLEPFENMAYMSLGIVIAYLVDVVLKIREFNKYCCNNCHTVWNFYFNRC